MRAHDFERARERRIEALIERHARGTSRVHSMTRAIPRPRERDLNGVISPGTRDSGSNFQGERAHLRERNALDNGTVCQNQ